MATEYRHFTREDKIRTFIFQNMKPYYDVLDMKFILNNFDFYRDFRKKQLTKDDYIYKADFIGHSINSIYGEKITKQLYKLNDDKTLYYIHQSFKDNKPIWEVIKTNSEIWKLTDEVLKLENKYANKVLKKKAND